MTPSIRPACGSDRVGIARVILPVIRAGETYALDPEMSEPAALAYWLGPDRETFVADADGAILGTYYLRANAAGGGAHVANYGFVTAAEAVGRGIARRMCQDALTRARAQGFSAMQFNFVVATNDGAVRLWRSLGFDVVGRLPGAFRHPRVGPVDALVMFTAL